jgi:hypothetical protein
MKHFTFIHIVDAFLFFSNVGDALGVTHESSCDEFQSVYFISKLFPNI